LQRLGILVFGQQIDLKIKVVPLLCLDGTSDSAFDLALDPGTRLLYHVAS
jgi:hypothetical protein